MTVSSIIGLQFGDEGKGKLTDFLSEKYDIIVRYQGGDNAGHSIQINNNKFHVRLIPSGVFKGKTVVIGNGVVLNPKILLSELEYLKENGFDVKGLLISNKAHVIMPYHMEMDGLNESIKDDKNKIGTTKRGIGPCYEDKVARVGVRIQDLMDKKILEEKIKQALTHKNILFKHYNVQTFDEKALAEEYFEIGQKIKEYIIDSTLYLNNAIDSGKNILLEGAQGSMLDVEFGTYPFVTSSSPMTGLSQGTGIAFNRITNSIGIIKAYLTRVGNGPMLTELFDEIGNKIREVGHEYGTVTKRPRRIGWLDLPNLKYTTTISGARSVVITLLDVLTGIEEIKICTHYVDDQGNEYHEYINDDKILSTLKPVYKTFNGWKEDITKMTTYNELPQAAREYIEYIAKELKVKIDYVSVGSDRKQTIKVE